MFTVSVRDFETWRLAARNSLLNGFDPSQIIWSDDEQSLFDNAPVAAPSSRLTIPSEFLASAKTVAMHRSPSRWSLLYRVLFRLVCEDRNLLRIEVDDDVRQMRLMEKAVSRDMHKMKAFVRFRRVEGSEPQQFVAWHKPDHYIVEVMAPWFAARFGNMIWSILTPDRSAHWALEKLSFGPGAPMSQAPQGDALEYLWTAYYSSIFNPARVKVDAMKKEMPVRHWATMPETRAIPHLLSRADARVNLMKESQAHSASQWVKIGAPLTELREAAKHCQGCELFRNATKVVFGEGPPHAKVVFVGEQPGDEEDLAARPFVGPAGRLLDRAFADAGIDRTQVYITNAVKHFKFVERGKRRIHAKPSGIEVSSCRPWLEAELTAIKPELIVCLGATAAQSLMGRDFRITTERGQFFAHRWARHLTATIHPSAILRMPDPAIQENEYHLLVADLRRIVEKLAEAA